MPLLFVLMGCLMLAGLVWLGTRIPLKSFETPTHAPFLPDVMPMPQDLPEPVARYAETVLGPHVPCVVSALVIGKARLTFMGITFPARFKFFYQLGESYYHYIQLGWFGQPILTVHERYHNGIATMDLPVGRIENNPRVNAAANQGLWAEGIWCPSIFFTDPRVRWQAVDDTHALLTAPNAAAEETFTVRFDPRTHLIAEMQSQRYKEATSPTRTCWINRALKWRVMNGISVPVVADLQWGNDQPWARWELEAVIYNTDVSRRMAQFGVEMRD